MSTKRLALAAVALGALLTMVGLAGATANPYATGFEPTTFSTTFDNSATQPAGSVNAQDGWHSLIPGQIPWGYPNPQSVWGHGYDQQVVDNSGYANPIPPDWGTQSLRVSNAYTEPTGEFLYQTYSPSIDNPAGETQTNTVFDGSFQFISTAAAKQDGLFVSVSPDNGSGGRMSYVSLEDTDGGIHVTFYDTSGDPNNADQGFVAYDAGTYSFDEVHTVQFLIQFVAGESNDIVRLIIDNKDIGDDLGACFTTWEQFYRNHQPGNLPVKTDSFEFRTAGGGTTLTNLIGGGYLFDNVSTAARNTDGPAPTTCGVPEVGMIAPTGTTCSQYRDGTAQTLERVQYTTSKGVIGSVSPGVFFYYTKVSGDAGQLVGFNQESTPPYVAIPIQQGQVFLYNASTCTKLKWAAGEQNWTLPSDGDLIIGVKYDASALKGNEPPSSVPVEYSFETTLDGTLVDTGATIELASKK